MKTLKLKHQSDICWMSTCTILLLHIHNASRRTCPAFYYERRVSINERLLSILSAIVNEKEESVLLIKKELFIYNHFVKQNPKTVIDWNKVAIEGEQQYIQSHTGVINEITDPLFRFITTVETPEYVFIHNTLIHHDELDLLLLFKHIAIQLNYLKD